MIPQYYITFVSAWQRNEWKINLNSHGNFFWIQKKFREYKKTNKADLVFRNEQVKENA